jgi:uncharacterized membrane protein
MWTLREMGQGRPIDRPIHPMLIHFPIAFTIGALALDALSLLIGLRSGPIAATWLVVGALAGFVGAAIAGLADRSAMPKDAKVRRVATRHALVQVVAAAVVALNLAVRWSDRGVFEAEAAWIVLDVIGALLVGMGADLGGRMVYGMGWRPGWEG